MRRERAFILFSLNLGTLPVLLIAWCFYRHLFFFLCSKRVKKYFGPLIIRIGASQVLGRDYYQGGTHYEGQRNAVDAARKINKRFTAMGKALRELGGYDGYESIVEHALGISCFREAYMAPFLLRFFEDLKFRGLGADFFSLKSFSTFTFPRPILSDIKAIRWHFIIIQPAWFIIRFVIVLAFLLFPIANIAHLFRKGVRIGRPQGSTNLKPLFVHRHSEYDGGSMSLPRDMYLFRSGVLDFKNWLHTPMSTRRGFDTDKIAFLESVGGEMLLSSDLRAPLKFLVTHVFVNYFRFCLLSIRTLMTDSAITGRFLLILFEYLHLQLYCSILLDNRAVSFVYCETELSPLARVLALEARKRSIKSASMIHGTGIQSLKYIHRMNMQFDYLLTPGSGFETLKETCPQIRHFIPVGNHEVDLTRPGPKVLPEAILKTRDRYKIVGIMLDFQTGFIEEDSHFPGGSVIDSVTVDETRIEKHVQALLQPLIDWISRRPDVIILWKPKRFSADKNENHPFLRPLINQIPKEQIIFHTLSQMYETIPYCDACITSGFSSAVSNAMSYGVPTISFDTAYGKLESHYHPWMSAETGKELVHCLESTLEHGLPQDAFDKFNADYYGEGIVDFKTNERLTAFFSSVIPNNNAHMAPRGEAA